MMNLVAMIGNVANDPELRYTPSGKAVCTFRIAVSRPGGEQADFMTVVAWERQAEVCDRYVHIGRRVAVEGRLHQSIWEHEGERRSRIEVVAHRVELLGAPRADTDRANRGHNTPDADAEPATGESADTAATTEPEMAVT